MEKGGGFFLTGRSAMEVGKWTSAATLSSSSFSDNHPMAPGLVGARGAHQLEYQLPQFHPQQQQHHLLTCLKLGKKRQNENYGEAGDQQMGIKREKPEILGGGGVIPRCQVEGCNKPLLDAKDYHRRHKVCEMHSKAPRVVVLGGEQRFCQQCSRFHAITEFDDTKRSCRRRLAGHNERRRKNTNAIMRNPSLESSIMGSRFAYLSQTLPGRALSLLSSDTTPWIPTPELSSRSSAALRELMAENRAAQLARQLFSDRGWHNVGIGNQSVLTYIPNQNQGPHVAPAQLVDGWNKFPDSGTHVTLNLMQTPNSTSFECISGNKSKEDEEQCCEIWKSLECTHVV